MEKTSLKFKLPACGMWFGPALHDNQKFHLTRSGLIHTRWEPENFSMEEEFDDFMQEELGNFVLPIGNFAKTPLAMWRNYQLGELGIPEPQPDWKNLKNLSFDNGPDFAEYKSTRYGAWMTALLEKIKKTDAGAVILYSDGVLEHTENLTDYPNYMGYNFGEKNVMNVPEAENLQQIAETFIRKVREAVEYRRRNGWGRTLTTSASFYFDYEIAAGVDVPVCEDFAFRNLTVSSALSRGLMRQYDLEFWGSHVAHEHYSWISFANPRKFPLLKAAFFLKYMHGAKMIINESGHGTARSQMAPDAPMLSTPRVIAPGGIRETSPELYTDLIPTLDEKLANIKRSSPVVQNYRKVLKEFYAFLKENPAPAGQPEAKIAIIKGRYDITTTPWASTSTPLGGAVNAAKKNPAYYGSVPEKSWEMVQNIFTPFPDILGGEKNQFLSASPYGMFDIVSFTGTLPDAGKLQQYQLMIFPGWNSAVPEHYQLMIEYVRNGGTLIIGLPQLCTGIDRKIHELCPDDLINNGDISELCGVKVTSVWQHGVYWSINGNNSGSGFALSRRRGIFNIKLGEIEITDPKVKALVTEDECSHPVILERPLGKGKVILINCWNYACEMDIDEGPGAMTVPEGMITELYRYFASQTTPTVKVTENGKLPQFTVHSYFPEDKSLCLLNLDFDHPQQLEFHCNGKTESRTLGPAEFVKINL